MRKLIFFLATITTFLGQPMIVQAEPQEGSVYIVPDTWNWNEAFNGVRFAGEFNNTSGEELLIEPRFVFRDSINKILQVSSWRFTISRTIPSAFEVFVDTSTIQATKRIDVTIQIIRSFDDDIFFYTPFPDPDFESTAPLISDLEPQPSKTLTGDLDNDGDVDFGDFLLFAQNFGKHL